jgi:hypothetical protein
MRGRLGLVADGEPVELDGSVVGPASFAVADALPAADQVACRDSRSPPGRARRNTKRARQTAARAAAARNRE